VKHADAFRIEASEYGVAVKCTFCAVRIKGLRHEDTWRSVAAVVKNHVCAPLRAALDAPPVLVGQATLSNELGLCNSAYRPEADGGKHVVLCSGHHPLDAETHSGGGYIWQDTEAENYA
jgi:hypothetical protein